MVRWSVETNHRKLMQAARDRVFADYRMLIGEVVVDTRPPAGQMLLRQPLDVTGSSQIMPGCLIGSWKSRLP